MKVMTINIKNEVQVMKDFGNAFKNAQKRRPFKKKTGTYFTDLDAVRNFLTPRRLELLHVIKEKNPHSLYELAKFVDRSFPSILRDVEILTTHGLIKLSKDALSVRNAVQPEVNYDMINLRIAV